MKVYLVEEAGVEWEPIDSVWSSLELATERARVIEAHPSGLVDRVSVYELDLDAPPDKSINDITDEWRQGASRKPVYRAPVPNPEGVN